jgi:Cyclic nucleotide-binding domain
VVGAANSVEDVAAFTLLQRIVPDAVLTRVLGVLWGLAMGAVALGSIAAPVVVGLVGPRAALVATGLILPTLALFAWRFLAAIDRSTPGPAAELALIDSVPMLAPLSLAAKECLATSLVPVSVAAGEVVIREGDVGDRFYIVAAGELEVVGERLRVTARTGDHFGEIALLRDVPRTATVRAIVDSRLCALERGDFITAVSGHSDVRAAGDAITDERLARGGRAPSSTA